MPERTFEQQAALMLERIRRAGDAGAHWRDLMGGSTAGLLTAEHRRFMRLLVRVRELAAVEGKVIPRPLIGSDRAARYRLADAVGPETGDSGARAGLVMTLHDLISRLQTVVEVFAVLRTSTALTPAERGRITRAHTAALGDVARHEDLLDLVLALPAGALGDAIAPEEWIGDAD